MTKKRIISFVLSAIMIISSVTTAFALDGYTGTKDIPGSCNSGVNFTVQDNSGSPGGGSGGETGTTEIFSVYVTLMFQVMQ